MVTGGAGFIGSHVVDRLIQGGHEVLVLDDLSTGLVANLPPETRLERRSLGREPVSDLFASWRPEAVVHAAAQVSVAASARNPSADAQSNVLGGLSVLEGAVAHGCSAFVYLSTGGALYGEVGAHAADEDNPIGPVSPYGVSKWAFERYLAVMAPSSLRWATLRPANVYGPRQHADGEGGVVSIFAAAMLRGEPIKIHGDGGQTRDFVYVEDVARAVAAALDGPRALVANIGTGTATSVSELFRLLADLTAYKASPSHVEARAGDLRNSLVSPARADRELRWRPVVPLADGLRRTLAWLSSNPT
jgi:UDP-glucose 4-epimerase